MEKINFVNLSTPALNATNLNKLQDNVEDAIDELEATQDDKIEELETTQNNKVKTQKTSSDTDVYCCNYVNELCNTITFNNEWRTAFLPSGGGLMLNIPIFNPSNESPTVNITSAQLYDGTNWNNLGSASLSAYNTAECIIRIQHSLSITEGRVYLVRLKGSISIN